MQTKLLLVGAIAAVLALPAAAQADTVTLSNSDGIAFAAGDPDLHPGEPNPSTITGPAGTVNDVNVSVQESHTNPDDLDIQLVSPNGTAVFIHSDACGADAEFQTLRFDDASLTNISDLGPCDQSQTYDVSNYNPMGQVDVYSGMGASQTPLNALSFFNGGPSGGAWRLFTMDDLTGNGGSITSWSITLDFTPAPAQTPTIPGTTPTPPTTPAQQKCKKKKKKKRNASAAACKKKKKRKK
jgi:subtilisin-like proprotein convertase family protein